MVIRLEKRKMTIKGKRILGSKEKKLRRQRRQDKRKERKEEQERR
jgi:hypothetical protein